VKFG
jgi:hypothetical protein